MDKKQIKRIAALITEDPDIFTEGWEELGIEDPNLEPEDKAWSPETEKDPGVLETIFGKNVDPDRYLVRVGKNAWAMLPFGGDVITILKSKNYVPHSISELLSSWNFSRADVSIVFDPQEWAVEWMHGWDVTEEMLLKMGIY